MKKYTKEEIEQGILWVPVEEVKTNDWNPKLKRSEEYLKVKESVELNGQVQPIIVRETGEEPIKYEILDGEQRFTALKELGEEKVWILNLGKVADEEARASTIWLEQAVPFDDTMLGELLIELKDKVELPYTDEEIELIAGVQLVGTEEDEEDEEETKPSIQNLRLEIAKEDELELKEIIRKIQIEYAQFPAKTVNYAIIKLAEMKESHELLKQLIETKAEEENEEINN